MAVGVFGTLAAVFWLRQQRSAMLYKITAAVGAGEGEGKEDEDERDLRLLRHRPGSKVPLVPR